MPVELSELMQLVAGKKPCLPVGDLPRVVAEAIGCHPAIVYLGHEEVLKIVHKHGANIRVEELQSLHMVIRDGEYRYDPLRPRNVTVYYEGRDEEKISVIGLKPAARGGEVWVCTYFRATPRNIKNQRERAALLRPHARKR